MIAELAGFPAVVVVDKDFVNSAKTTYRGLGGLQGYIATYPGAFDVHSPEQLVKNVNEVTGDNVVKGLTQTIPQDPDPEEPEPSAAVFSGTFEEVNAYFMDKVWSDSMPIVPPTIEKVQAFLKYTDLKPDFELGRIPIANRQVTPWNVAVNGVMAGCRPEYMPVLLAIAQCLIDPQMMIWDTGRTGGDTQMLVLSGPIVKQLKFAVSTGQTRFSFQPNTTCGRAYRLMLRNLGGQIPLTQGGSDSASFGQPFLAVLAEDQDTIKEFGWTPLSQRLGPLLKPVDNAIVLGKWQPGSQSTIGGTTAKAVMDNMVKATTWSVYGAPSALTEADVEAGYSTSPARPWVPASMTVIPKCIVEILAKEGNKPEDVQKYIFENAKAAWADACKIVEQGWAYAWPAKTLCPDPSKPDPKALLPRYHDPSEILITVGGTPERNRWIHQSAARCVAKEIKLPPNWDTLVAAL